MATKKPAKTPGTWTKAEEELGRNLIHEARNHDGDFLKRFSNAAIKMGYRSYSAVPPGTRSFISSIAGQSRRKSPAAIRTVDKKPAKKKPSKKKEPSAPTEMTQEQLWLEEYAKSKSLQHGLHPEDDTAFIKYFQDRNHKR